VMINIGIILVIIIGIIAYFSTNLKNMDSNKKPSAKDFFLNLGAIVALYTVVVSLVNLLFTIINYAYPQVTNGYNYYYNTSQSISWPVAALIIFFPILIILMWILEKEYKNNPEERNTSIHRLLTYITLFIAGLVVAGDLVTVLYYFLDGQELTTGFLLKVLVLFVISGGLFFYYLSDIRGTLTSKSRMVWRVVSGVVILASIAWGFAVLGSPATQRLYKYDDQKVMALQNINNYVTSYYQMKESLPASVGEIQTNEPYATLPVDPQTNKPYEYKKTGNLTYELCAEFNKATNNRGQKNLSIAYPYGTGDMTWTHPAGHYCFKQTINPNMFPGLKLPM